MTAASWLPAALAGTNSWQKHQPVVHLTDVYHQPLFTESFAGFFGQSELKGIGSSSYSPICVQDQGFGELRCTHVITEAMHVNG